MDIKKVLEFFNPWNIVDGGEPQRLKRPEMYNYPPEFRPSETDQKRLSRGSGLLAVVVFLVVWVLLILVAPLNFLFAFLAAWGANRYWHVRAQRKAAEIARENFTRHNLT